MKHKLSWLALAVALAVPATVAWGGEGKVAKTDRPASCCPEDCPVCSNPSCPIRSHPR